MVGAGGERPQREAESPQQEGLPLLRGPDTRNRTSNPDSWVLPGRTTIGQETHSTAPVRGHGTPTGNQASYG